MVAISESSDATALAAADSFAGVSGGTEVLVGASVQSASSTQSPTGSVAAATSTTNVVAADIYPSTGGSEATVETSAASEDDPVAGAIDAQANGDIDGNIALIEFDAVAVGDDTLVSVDAFALAIEDELSVSQGLIEIAIG
jgi:hypothetical protein